MKIVECTYRYGGTEATARPRPHDAAAARDRLDGGSRATAALLAGLSEGNGAAQQSSTSIRATLVLDSGDRARAARQRPFAAVLGCSDARVPIELIFNEGPNDLFVVRVAGNGLGTEVLGSLKYAVDHLGEQSEAHRRPRAQRLRRRIGSGRCVSQPAGLSPACREAPLRGILDRLLIVVHPPPSEWRWSMDPRS